MPASALARWLVPVTAAALAVPLPTVAGATPPSTPDSPIHKVMLLTGDVVTFTEDATFVVEPAERADHRPVTFTAERRGADLFVVPSDARRRITAGTADLALFNVKDLAQQGFSSTSLPVIVSYPESQAPPPLATRALPAVNGSAVTVDLASAPAFWAGLDPAAEVWLDRRLRVSLDQSVPQIGAPVAWRAGHDGTGVPIAILDTGVDGTHPDLAGKVAVAKDFTGEGIADGYGHGTHVATTIAGSGAASGGRYKGVAPGATLLAGKVCDSGGLCPSSAILAGMDWAARSGARVINMSLGGGPSDGTDVLSRAVDRLTLRSGALFVVAAGNSGCPTCVSTPATAGSALAVGAVDKSDHLADFSSRGPRLRDGAVKPEITAPGVAITAGRAADTSMGSPVDEHYTSSSGTSMATPHVAGAAGLLAQAHPEWRALQLKQALVSTARDGGYSVFEQGAGRVDVARADLQPVRATASLNFGSMSSGGAKQITYTNDGSTPVALRLAVEMRSYTGDPAAVGRLSATTVTVPARSVASVFLTINPFAAPPGVYSGLVRATSTDGTVSVRTPVSYYLPTRTVPVTVRLLDFTGQPVHGDGFAVLAGGVLANDPFHTDPFQVVPLSNGVGTLRVPVGTYTAFASVIDRPGQRAAWVAATNTTVTRPSEIVLDARTATPSTVDTGDGATVANHQLMLSYNTPTSSWSTVLPGGRDLRLYATPAAPVRGDGRLVMQDHVTLIRPGAVYNLNFSQDNGIPAVLAHRPGDLTAVDTSYHADRPGLRLTHAWWGFRTGSTGILLRPNVILDAPARVTEYVNRDDRVAWTRYAMLSTVDGRDNYGMYNRGPFPAAESWFAGPVAPTVPGFYRVGVAGGDQFRPTHFVNDSVTNHLLDVDVRNEYPVTWRMFLGQTEIAPRTVPGSQVPAFALPDGPGTYTLRSSMVLRPTAGAVPSLAVRRHSPRVDTDWTFRSGSATGTACTPFGFDFRCDVQPLLQLGYDLGLSLDNQTPAGPHTVAVTAAHPANAVDGADVVRLSVDYSVDAGATWQAAPVVPAGPGRCQAVITNPASGLVWLRTEATDGAGNTVTQIVQDAYSTTG